MTSGRRPEDRLHVVPEPGHREPAEPVHTAGHALDVPLLGELDETDLMQPGHPGLGRREVRATPTAHDAPSRPASLADAGSLFEMTLREGAARAGLQVALEAQGREFIGEVESYHHFPRSVACRMRAPTRVVRGEPSVHVVREADVRPMWFRDAPKDVDDVLGRHVAAGCKAAAER